ncbi:hypothetical protein, partial [Agrobacterium vitis]|uniref:hypothetical protein n=1 Tax=Agrobacterium vitis TaxID=373 RepID=UPI001F3EC1F3
PITRTCFALCNPGQRRAIQVLIVNTGVNIGRRYGVNFPRRLTDKVMAGLEGVKLRKLHCKISN